MKQLGTAMPLKDLEKIYNEFAKKMDDVVKNGSEKNRPTI